MKIFDLLILLLSLLVIGCSTTYRVSDFASRDKFYNDFNKFAKDKSVKVTLVNDSSFYINNGAAIVNDTLYYLGKDILTGNKKIALSETKEINYTSNDYTPSSIELNNGQIFQAKQIKVNRDSIEFLSMNKVIVLNSITSINKVKKISYKNHFLGSVCF